MFPEYVSNVLADLGYISLILIAPCTIYNTIRSLTISALLDKHIAIDTFKFEQQSGNIQVLFSKINDLKSEHEKSTAERLRVLLRKDAHFNEP
jgi:hypothetical protein